MKEQKAEKKEVTKFSLGVDATLLLTTAFLSGGVVVLTALYFLLK